ncbi:MAG: ABC transporter ATP-binding protein [Xenophilus sp.]
MATRRAPLLELDRVRFSYDGRRVIDDLSFSVTQGETLALLGPSGCGKTTVLNLLAGFLLPDAGEVRIGGTRVTAPGPDRGVVFQSYALFDWMTVSENIAFALRCAGRPLSEQRRVAAEMAELVGLQGWERAYPYELSGGMKQRCCLARVLAARPRVMLMDEPFAAVDIQTRERLQEEILAIQEALGTTLVFVTHSIDEAIFLGHRILLFDPAGANAESTSVREFEVDLPAPRARAQIRLDPRFLDLRNEIYLAMHRPALHAS